jgi:hypothetical protein
MQLSFHYGSPTPLSSFDELLSAMPDQEFRTSRSTVPLLAWWSGGPGEALLASLGIEDPATGTAAFEYPVSPRCDSCKGRGKASFTDLMLETPRNAIAIEAKFRESLYETVGQWLGPPPNENRRLVLEHWLRCCIGSAAPVPDCERLVYQMVHRTASACHVARRTGKSPHVVHLLFSDQHADAYVTAVQQLATTVATALPVRFTVVYVATEEGPDRAAVVADGTADAVRGALLDRRELFRFAAPKVLLATCAGGG